MFAGAGQLATVLDLTPITVSGSFNYSQSANVTVTTGNSIIGFMTWSDGAGHTDQFDLTSVYTINFTGGSAGTIGLYLLGSLSDPGAGLTPTLASMTMTLNNTNGGPYTFSATMADPPSGVPEPASILLLGAGFAGLSLVRRRKA